MEDFSRPEGPWLLGPLVPTLKSLFSSGGFSFFFYGTGKDAGVRTGRHRHAIRRARPQAYLCRQCDSMRASERVVGTEGDAAV